MTNTIKSVVIYNYVQGLASWLDDNGIDWESVDAKNQKIRIFYTEEAELFNIGFMFGKFYIGSDR